MGYGGGGQGARKAEGKIGREKERRIEVDSICFLYVDGGGGGGGGRRGCRGEERGGGSEAARAGRSFTGSPRALWCAAPRQVVCIINKRSGCNIQYLIIPSVSHARDCHPTHNPLLSPTCLQRRPPPRRTSAAAAVEPKWRGARRSGRICI